MAGKRRTAGRAARNESQRAGIKGGSRYGRPALKHVYAAVETGHIDDEQAADLNSFYNPNKKYGKDGTTNQRNQHRQYKQGAAPLSANQSDVHHAFKSGHINEEEARDLNPTFNASKPRVAYNRSNIAAPLRPTEVAKAHKEGHITKEEADDLHPNWQRSHNRARANKAISSSHGKIPILQDIYKAHSAGHITPEEATDLNANYKPTDKEQQKQLKRFNKNKDIKASGEGRTPSQTNIHRAVKQGHITLEEGTALNPAYPPSDPLKMKHLKANVNKMDSGYHKKGKQFVNINPGGDDVRKV